MHFTDFKNYILKINDYKLPGHNYLLKIAPPSRIKHLKTNLIPENSKTASVLMLFYPDINNETRLVLMLRNKYKGVHSNQISLPGGKVDRLDKSLKDTALRETHEEIGLHKDDIDIVGDLSSVYIPPSNFMVYPFLGIAKQQLQFIKQDSEVEDIIEVTLADFLNENNVINTKVATSYNVKVEVPAFKLNGHIVWGATAMMLSEIKVLLKEVL